MDIKHQQFKVSDFLSWQREGSLILSPSFQRRPVWRPSAKSYLLDTVARGLPVPIIFIRERINLTTQTTIREIVDGQQRLRTLFTFIDSDSLPDFDKTRDQFSVSARHNKELAGKTFTRLDNETKRRILGYEFSTHVLPPDTEDRDVLMIFARLNSTGVQLNGQELRNAEYFGIFKSAMYDLALEQLDRWRTWRIFNEDQIARMNEVELTSDLVMTMIDGLTGKSQAKLNAIYKRNDAQFPNETTVVMRFQRVMDIVDEILGKNIPTTVFSSEVYFYSLFVLIYDLLYGLNSPLSNQVSPNRVDQRMLRERMLEVSANFRSGDVPEEVLDAIRRASADLGRRRTRHDYLRKMYLDSTG
jgi:Protein of unknown function DUF262